MNSKNILNLGISSCPNDTFIFHALLHGLSSRELHEKIRFNVHMADVEELNKLAMQGKLEISKMSLGVVPYILDKYRILASGGALGWGVGPLLVARKVLSDAERKNATIAIPGKMTTANLLLNMHGGFTGQRREMIFSDIIPAVVSGEVDMGLIIHEGRFTYQNHGLRKVLDLGEWWESQYSVPLPLGIIAIRKDVDQRLAKNLESAITKSVQYAWANPDCSRTYIRQHAQELDDAVTEAHIRTFVTEYSADLGQKGKAAIERILRLSGVGRSGSDIFLA